MTLRALLVGLLYLAVVGPSVAVNFVLPSNGAQWSATGPNTITWTNEPSTPTFVNIQLVHNNDSVFQPIPNLLPVDGVFAAGIDLQSGMMDLWPSCIAGSPSLPTGTGYSLRMFTQTPDGTQTTVATTNGTFDIVKGTVTQCLGSINGTTGSSLSNAPTSVATASIHSSSSSSSRAGAIAGGIIGGILVCAAVAAGTVMYNRHRRDVRKRITMQFMMKRGLGIGKPVDSKDAEMA